MKKFNFRFKPLPDNKRLKTREDFYHEEDYQRYLGSDEYQDTLKYREEVRQSKIETVKTYLLLVSSAFILLITLFGSWFVVADSYGEFEYHTASGQTGTAEYCAIGYGQASCRTADKEVVIVESYRKVK